MNIKSLVKDYFSFSRRDRTGILVLTSIIVFIYCLPYLINKPQHEPVLPIDLLALVTDSLDRAEKQQPGQGFSSQRDQNRQEEKMQVRAALFRFDPNTLTVDGWQRLGLSEKAALTIDKYRNKGGRFYQPEDLQKIWGLPDGFYERVRSHIDLPDKGQSPYSSEKTQWTKTEKKVLKAFDINAADSTILEALPGIGPKLAARIIGFREKLGGFYSVVQVKETYGLQDSTFQKIKTYLRLETLPKKINLNTATKEVLRAHPYFKWNIANAIIEYRNQHGPFRDLESLRKVALIEVDVYNKISPYLFVE